MKSTHLVVAIIFFSSAVSCAQEKAKNRYGACEDCELMFQGMPSRLSWETTLAGPGEAGEPMIITGTIFRQDGRTPAEGVTIYVYHTDSKGLYTPAKDQSLARRHGHLRGWMKTGKDGKYQFTTIRPAAYPNRKDPQHIHPIISETENSYYWIDEYLFEDDPLLTEAFRKKQEKRGGSGIIQLTKNKAGIWVGHRDIILGLNVPGYN